MSQGSEALRARSSSGSTEEAQSSCCSGSTSEADPKLGTKDNVAQGTARDGAEVAETPSQQREYLPCLWRQERLGIQVIVFVFGLGLYSQREQGLSVETGFQLDLVRLKTWLNSRWGDAMPEEWAAVMPDPPGWMAVALIAVVIWAFGEATAFPRHHSMRSALDYARLMMQFVGDVALIPFFLLMPGELTEVCYAPTTQNERILSHCPSMWRFKQTPWLRNAFLSFGVLVFYDFTGNSESMVHRENLRMPDGGVVALDWWGVSKPGANGKNKILFVSSTWSGDALVCFSKLICKYFAANGWQCVVMVKRGCGLTMPNEQPPLEGGARAAPWGLSGFEDLQMAIDHVAASCPGLPVCGLGPSLGAGQLRNYVNKTGSQNKLAAAVVVDAGEDWVLAFESLDRRLPVITAALKEAADRTFDICGVPTKCGDPKDKLAGNYFAQLVQERMAPAHGFEASRAGASQYLRSCQPADPAGCKIPTLEILTFNDLLTDPPMIRTLQKLYLASPNIVTCTTRLGTHVVRWGGFRGECWISRVGCEFLEAALKRQAEQAEDFCLSR